MNNNRLFYVINEEGIKQEADIIAKFKLQNNLNYIVYSYNEINDNDMIKIYSTGIVGTLGNYSYKEIGNNEEWNEIKEMLKLLARDDTKEVPEKNKCNLKILGEEVSVRNPKKLLVSNKFAKAVSEKYNEESNSTLKFEEEAVTEFKLPIINEIREEKPVVNEPAVSVPIQEQALVQTPPTHKTINVPTFEELQARSKKVSDVIESSKPEVKEEIYKPEVKEVLAPKKENYTEKFKNEVEPVLLDVYSKQQAQIDALEEELSKTKYNLFEEQKLSLSLKTANKELAEKGSRLETELKDAQEKVDGIMHLLQGSK